MRFPRATKGAIVFVQRNIQTTCNWSRGNSFSGGAKNDTREIPAMLYRAVEHPVLENLHNKHAKYITKKKTRSH